jgi:hypothetical protein
VLGWIDRDPSPHDGSVERAADDPVTLPDCRCGQSLADVRFAHPPAAFRVVAGAPVAHVLVALMRLGGSVLYLILAPTAVNPAPTQLRVEGVQGLDIKPC